MSSVTYSMQTSQTAFPLVVYLATTGALTNSLVLRCAGYAYEKVLHNSLQATCVLGSSGMQL